MQRDRVISILRKHKNELRSKGVASLALFGSTARDEAQEDSDVDLLVEFDRSVGLFDVFGFSTVWKIFRGLEGGLAQREPNIPLCAMRSVRKPSMSPRQWRFFLNIIRAIEDRAILLE